MSHTHTHHGRTTLDTFWRSHPSVTFTLIVSRTSPWLAKPHHMLAHGWADDGDGNSNITLPGAPSSLKQADQCMEYENPIAATDG